MPGADALHKCHVECLRNLMITPTAHRTISEADWQREGELLFGPDRRAWRFVCPSCAHIARVTDWQRSGAPEGAVAYNCIGRFPGSGVSPQDAATAAFGRSGGPCNYTGGGIFNLNPVTINFDDGRESGRFFEFELTAAHQAPAASADSLPAEVK